MSSSPFQDIILSIPKTRARAALHKIYTRDIFFIKNFHYYLMCMDVCLFTLLGQKRTLDPLGVGVLTVVNYCTGSGNQI